MRPSVSPLSIPAPVTYPSSSPPSFLNFFEKPDVNWKLWCHLLKCACIFLCAQKSRRTTLFPLCTEIEMHTYVVFVCYLKATGARASCLLTYCSRLMFCHFSDFCISHSFIIGIPGRLYSNPHLLFLCILLFLLIFNFTTSSFFYSPLKEFLIFSASKISFSTIIMRSTATKDKAIVHNASFTVIL